MAAGRQRGNRLKMSGCRAGLAGQCRDPGRSLRRNAKAGATQSTPSVETQSYATENKTSRPGKLLILGNGWIGKRNTLQ
ncbi:MAG: hypothetical protein DMG41_05420 [Acidobacteria bacterium]|nr:MAG: hypothetical protein AUH13_28230 [Acidobacteria bacterium 13_2_20CM_58_27]PYT63344.1 MAG: hypothetical protein DMG42_36420 [Acidobacteriota bacterium]PYT90186.1 MAG: hypothetical protein DMG41_05420 [Acidobacteriota bacterium]